MNTDAVAVAMAAFAILLRLISIAWHHVSRAFQRRKARNQ